MTTQAKVLLAVAAVTLLLFVAPRRRLWAPVTVLLLTALLAWTLGAV